MVFGRVVVGEDVVTAMENEYVDSSSKPFSQIVIERSGELVLQRVQKSSPVPAAGEDMSDSSSDESSSESSNEETSRERRKRLRKEEKALKKEEKRKRKAEKKQKGGKDYSSDRSPSPSTRKIPEKRVVRPVEPQVINGKVVKGRGVSWYHKDNDILSTAVRRRREQSRRPDRRNDRPYDRRSDDPPSRDRYERFDRDERDRRHLDSRDPRREERWSRHSDRDSTRGRESPPTGERRRRSPSRTRSPKRTFLSRSRSPKRALGASPPPKSPISRSPEA